MLLQKTEKARLELQPGVRTLGQRERSLLLLANGNTSLDDFKPMFNGEGLQVVLDLLADGYLMPIVSNTAKRNTQIGRVSVQHADAIKLALKSVRESTAFQHSGPPSLSPNSVSPTLPGAPAHANDSFEGKRSLATTRMFLFDICERLFARKNPDQAQLFREALRNARDRDSMLVVARDILSQVENIAGSERADSLSERIAMLLPLDDFASV